MKPTKWDSVYQDLPLSKQLYEGLKSQGHGRDGTHALQLALNRLSGVDWN